ncbi:MAG: glycoside hydrolase family protein [Cytophagales bacterium]|nr:glycoside hydrolase family protein [Cytophagales bacterium]
MKVTLILIPAFLLILLSCNPQRADTIKEKGHFTSLNLKEQIQNIPNESYYQDEGWFTWGGSMVKGDDGKYYLFYSRWPYEVTHKGWLTTSEIACAVAEKPAGPYTFYSEVLKGRGKGHFDGNMVHNPHIHKFNGKYYLYYIGATKKEEWQQSRRTQRIGLAVSDNINGPWKRFDKPLLDVTPGSFDSGFTTNPSVVRKNDSTYVMVYKCLGDNNKVVHGVAFAKSPTGPFIKHPKPIFTLENSKFPAEDPFIFSYREKLYTILSDNYGEFTGIKQALCLFTSEDGVNWALAKHPLVSDRKIQWEGGTTEELEDLERPQIWFNEHGEPAILFCAATRGKRLPGNSFNIHIPLKKALPKE